MDAMSTPEPMCKTPEEGVSDPAAESTNVPAPLFLCAYRLEGGSPSVLHSTGGCGSNLSPLLSGVCPCNTNAIVQANDVGG